MVTMSSVFAERCNILIYLDGYNEFVYAERWNILIYLDGYNDINRTFELGIFSLTILNQLL